MQHCSIQHAATHCNALQHTVKHCNILQRTATYCNTLQHIILQFLDFGDNEGVSRDVTFSLHIRAHIHLPSHTHTHTHTHISAAHICTRTHAHTHAHTQAHTATQSDTHIPFHAQYVHTVNIETTSFQKKEMQFPMSITQYTLSISSVSFAKLAVLYFNCQPLQKCFF